MRKEERSPWVVWTRECKLKCVLWVAQNNITGGVDVGVLWVAQGRGEDVKKWVASNVG